MHPISHDVDLSIPVLVDLDGTLTPIDTLHEAIIRFLFLQHFIAFVRMFSWLLRRKAFFKSQMALTVSLDLSLLPWNEDVIEYIRVQKKNWPSDLSVYCEQPINRRDGVSVGVSSIVLSTQHLDASMSSADVRAVVEPYICEVLPEGWISADTAWHVNPTGKFVIGGPDGDAGLTGRKIIVDTYGGAAPHGGDAFSGKDPTKVDRSAAYAARYLAKNVVAAGLADKCTIQLSYAIGVARPLSIYADTFGTGQVDEEQIEKAVSDCMDLTPRGIRTHLGLNKPIYKRTAAYDHFGRAPDADGGFSWERINLTNSLVSNV